MCLSLAAALSLADCSSVSGAVANVSEVRHGHAAARGVRVPRETDRHKLDQRQKQIDFGKNTLGYAAYLRDIPRCKRRT